MGLISKMRDSAVWRFVSDLGTAGWLYSWTGGLGVVISLFPASFVGWLAYEAERNTDLVIIFTLATLTLVLIVIDVLVRWWPKSWKQNWYERERLEIYVLACLSANKRPELPVIKEPELARHRYLKDAILGKELSADLQDGKINVWSTVTLNAFELFINKKQHKDFLRVVKQWREIHPRRLITGEATFEITASANLTAADVTGKHDVWLYDAVHYIAARSWVAEKLSILTDDESYIASVFDAVQEAVQYGLDGDLPIWGRTGQSGPLELIDPNYWSRFGFDWFSLLREVPEEFRTEVEKERNTGPIYTNLKTSKAIVEKLWSPTETR